MKLADWLAGNQEVPRDPTPRAVQDDVVLEALRGQQAKSRRRLLAALVGLLLLLALFQPALSRQVARLAPPIAATGQFLLQATGPWQGHAIFTVDRSAVVLAAMADGTWPEPARVWPTVAAVPLAPDLYAVGPDHTGALMYYAHPGQAGHSAWLAAPGPDGRWASGKDDPREVAAAIDRLARQFETDALARLARGEPGGPWSYNVRWGDDHIVLFQLMLLARGRQAEVRERLAGAGGTSAPIESLDLPAVWTDQVPFARQLLQAICDETVPAADSLLPPT